MSRACAAVIAAAPWAWPSVAVLAWWSKIASSVDPDAFSRPSHITVLRNLRLVDGSGRRNSDSSLALAKPYGSLTAWSENSAFAGIGNPMRIRPLVSSMLYAVRRAASVETSALGEFEPSTVRKIGSVPLDASNRAWTPAGAIDQPWSIWWQVKHARPLLPSAWKNAPVWRIT